MKCAHTVLPFVTLVTSTNRSVLQDVCSILDIGRNGKQYLNSVRMCLNFLQQEYITINTIKTHIMIIIICTISCILSILCKSSAIFSSSDILIANKGGNILCIGFAFVDGMPELFMFIVINTIGIACIVFQYLIKNMISVSMSIMSHVKAA